MIANTADTLSRGMEILSQRMGIVDAERFIFLVKTEGFDYTKWQIHHKTGRYIFFVHLQCHFEKVV